jgi:hypothetical protein
MSAGILQIRVRHFGYVSASNEKVAEILSAGISVIAADLLMDALALNRIASIKCAHVVVVAIHRNMHTTLVNHAEIEPIQRAGIAINALQRDRFVDTLVASRIAPVVRRHIIVIAVLHFGCKDTTRSIKAQRNTGSWGVADRLRQTKWQA